MHKWPSLQAWGRQTVTSSQAEALARTPPQGAACQEGTSSSSVPWACLLPGGLQGGGGGGGRRGPPTGTSCVTRGTGGGPRGHCPGTHCPLSIRSSAHKRTVLQTANTLDVPGSALPLHAPAPSLGSRRAAKSRTSGGETRQGKPHRRPPAPTPLCLCPKLTSQTGRGEGHMRSWKGGPSFD